MATRSLQQPADKSFKHNPPHGGKLIGRQLRGDARVSALERAKSLRQVPISDSNAYDIEMIATGAYSPLSGFMGQSDYECVLEEMRLTDKTVWPIPITLSSPDDNLASRIEVGEEIALVQEAQHVVALMTVMEKFNYDKKREAELVYKTTNEKEHPGVLRIFACPGNVLLAGDVWLVNWPEPRLFPENRLTPAQTRAEITERGWRTIVGFQTRNPLHRGHEHVMRVALELVDGLLFQPLVGPSSCDDIPIDVRMQSYKVSPIRFFPAEQMLFSVFPAAMYYAGPREAIFHALCRKNYGCTHFIAGRNHAGIGDFYHPKHYSEVFDRFRPEGIGIKILNYAPTLYCPQCSGFASPKTCPHDKVEYFSGTETRKMLRDGVRPPEAIMRPEVSDILIAGLRQHKASAVKNKKA